MRILCHARDHPDEELLGAGWVGQPRSRIASISGSESPPVLVECESHTWTQGGNMPSAKMTVWNEAMYYFHVAPPSYRKILFVLKHFRKEQSLAAYYLKEHGHLVSPDMILEPPTAERLS